MSLRFENQAESSCWCKCYVCWTWVFLFFLYWNNSHNSIMV